MSKIFAPNRQRVLKQAMEWFVELQSEHCDENRQHCFQLWLAEHELHQWAYAEAEKLWSNMDNLRFSHIPALESARNAKSRTVLRPVLSALVICAAIAGGWQDYTAETLKFSTAIGQRRGIDLPDGSHIELNAASQLSVRASWFRRQIELIDGEAQFTVAHETFRPFTVDAGEMHIRDIGTVFTVRKHQQDVSLSVIEGEVTVNDEHHWFANNLKAGYSQKLDSQGHLQNTKQANIEQATGWIRGVLIFDHTSLADVAAEFERQHAVQFVFAEPNLSRQTVNGSFDINDIDSFLKVLEKMLPVRVKQDDKFIVLSKR